MDEADIDLRNATYRLFAELGRAPGPMGLTGSFWRLG